MNQATLHSLFTLVRWGSVDMIISASDHILIELSQEEILPPFPDLLLRSMKVCCNLTLNYKAKLELHWK